MPIPQTRTVPDIFSADEYEADLKEQKPHLKIKRVLEACSGPITTFRIEDGDDVRIITHRPPSVLALTTFHDSGLIGQAPHTLLAGDVWHLGSLDKRSNFPAETIKYGESSEEASIRCLSEEVPVIDPKWINRVQSMGYRYPSVGDSAQRIYSTHINVELPRGMTVSDLNGHIGGVAAEHERIRSKVQLVDKNLLSQVCGTADTLAIAQILDFLDMHSDRRLYKLEEPDGLKNL